ncbi:hypothetical protein OT358_09280, partial [Campylobacter jejuni]|nr:hypothetical protein [Campylobacter jejuni]
QDGLELYVVGTRKQRKVSKQVADFLQQHHLTALMLDLRTDFSLPCKLIVEEHFLYDSIFTRI